MCAEWGPFSQPQVLPAPVTTAQPEWHAWITADGRALYFHVVYTDGGDLYVARRSEPSEAFTAAQPVSELDTLDREANPSLSADQRIIVFDTQPAGMDMHLMIATRNDPSLPFDPATPLTVFDTAADELNASLSTDGLELFFVRSSIDTLIHLATRNTVAESFTTEITVPATELVGYHTQHVSISPDGRELYVSSNRPGGAGNHDVYVLKRDGPGLPFGPLVHVPELSSIGDDSVDSLSADGSTAYLAYNTNFAGNGDIHSAMRSCVAVPTR